MTTQLLRLFQAVSTCLCVLCLLTCRREALRFRRAMEDAQEQLGQVTDLNSRLKAELEAASTELAAVEEFANRR